MNEVSVTRALVALALMLPAYAIVVVGIANVREPLPGSVAQGCGSFLLRLAVVVTLLVLAGAVWFG